MTVTRDKLYADVWSEPMLAVAKRYGVSFLTLARICERLNVPRPPRGYWAKLAVGKAPPRTPLPALLPGDPEAWNRGSLPRSRPVRTLPSPPVQDPDRPVRRRRRAGPHPLVAGVEEHFLSGWDTPEGYLRPRRRTVVDLFVTRDTLQRALSTATKLFYAMEDRGFRVVLSADENHRRWEIDERLCPGDRRIEWKSWIPARPTVAFVGTVAIGLTLVESSDLVHARSQWSPGTPFRYVRAPSGSGRQHDMPIGRLCLIARSADSRASWERRWPETKAHDLARLAPTIAQELEREAPTIARLVAEGERQAEVRRRELRAAEERRQREERERRRAQALQESKAQLLEIAERWALARRLGAFFAEIEGRLSTQDDPSRQQLEARLVEARALLGGTDALEHFKGWVGPSGRLR